MGEAKRRGTRERRIAQSLERTRLEDEARRATLQREDEERRARIAALPPEERKAVIMGVGSPRHDARLLMAAMAGALAAPMPMILLDGRDTDIGTL
jgi:hypothetical protein